MTSFAFILGSVPLLTATAPERPAANRSARRLRRHARLHSSARHPVRPVFYIIMPPRRTGKTAQSAKATTPCTFSAVDVGRTMLSLEETFR